MMSEAFHGVQRKRERAGGPAWPLRLLPWLSGLLLLLSAAPPGRLVAPATFLLPAAYTLCGLLLLVLYGLARRGGRPLLRFTALLTFLGALAVMSALQIEASLVEPVGLTEPAPARDGRVYCLLQGASGLAVLVHWLLTRSRRPGEEAERRETGDDPEE